MAHSAVQIFISYARADDEPASGAPDAIGFVEFLYRWLDGRFKRCGSRRPLIWRYVDHTSPGEPFARRLEAELRKSSLLLVVMSRNWMASKYCRQELKYFKEYRKRMGEAAGERIVIVEKTAADLGRCRLGPGRAAPAANGDEHVLDHLYAALLKTTKRLGSRSARALPARRNRALKSRVRSM